MSNGSLIGLVGRKRVGKDTVAESLNVHRSFRRLAFADALKQVVYDTDAVIGWDIINYRPRRLQDYVDRFGWEKAKDDHPEVRRLLQAVGVAVRDNVSPTAWVDVVAGLAEDIREEGGNVVITDVRFPNEAELVENWGGTLVRVTRPGLPQDDLHISETALDAWPCDHTIQNDGSLEDLDRQVALLISREEI